ncbi:hypothetical protein GGP55_000429 [Salinibacter ruber]|nr:hypothetical protein [Salinibacter ruber]MCS3629854.1 hypothetical protein [Salinibacter ruber]MCS4033463.1 hypothetical protein [Salinibacter ruber]
MAVTLPLWNGPLSFRTARPAGAAPWASGGGDA